MIAKNEQVKVLLSGISTETLTAELARRKAAHRAERMTAQAKRRSDKAKAVRAAKRMNKYAPGDLDVLDTLASAGAAMTARGVGADVGMAHQGARRILDRLVAKKAVRESKTSPVTYAILKRGRDALSKHASKNTFPKRA